MTPVKVEVYNRMKHIYWVLSPLNATGVRVYISRNSNGKLTLNNLLVRCYDRWPAVTCLTIHLCV